MGGSFGFGNITPYAEFNFHTDPHAAKLVIQELSNKVILSPLNFTHKVIATSEIRKHMYDDNNEKRSSPIRNFLSYFDILLQSVCCKWIFGRPTNTRSIGCL